MEALRYKPMAWSPGPAQPHPVAAPTSTGVSATSASATDARRVPRTNWSPSRVGISATATSANPCGLAYGLTPALPNRLPACRWSLGHAVCRSIGEPEPTVDPFRDWIGSDAEPAPVDDVVYGS